MNRTVSLPARLAAIAQLCGLLVLAGCAGGTSRPAASPNPAIPPAASAAPPPAAPPAPSDLQTRAQNGDVVAQRQLGQNYDFGHGVAQDYGQAAKWYQLAADQGDAIAQNNLASLYQYGLGVPTNYLQAFELYQKAAAQGNAMAQNSLGYLLEFGVGVPTDKAAADMWYRRAADQGYPDAMLNLGINYARGDGVNRDLALAYMWLANARWLTQSNADTTVQSNLRDMLDAITNQMTSAQIQAGQALSAAWSTNYLNSHQP